LEKWCEKISLFCAEITQLAQLESFVNYQDQSGSILNWAFTRNPPLENETLATLVTLGFNTRAENSFGFSPFMSAAMFGNTDAITTLLDRDAAINLQDNLGNTALMLSVVEEEIDAALELAQSGADVTILNRKGDSAHSLCSSLAAVNDIFAGLADLIAIPQPSTTSSQPASQLIGSKRKSLGSSRDE
jgi:ankyrin repeat protein